MDTIYNKTVTYDAVPTPKTQHGSVKPQQPKSYSYTEPKAKTNQYVSNSVNTNNTANTYSYNSPKTYTYTQPKVYASTPPKTSVGEYKPLGSYTNTNPYVTKDRIGDAGSTVDYNPFGGYTNKNPYVSKDIVADYGQNSYSAQPKPQVKNHYTGVKNQNAADELWAKYGSRYINRIVNKH